MAICTLAGPVDSVHVAHHAGEVAGVLGTEDAHVEHETLVSGCYIRGVATCRRTE